MTVLLRNTQAFVLSVPHEVLDLSGAPFVLRPCGENGDAREVTVDMAAHPKLAACLRAGWVVVDASIETLLQPPSELIIATEDPPSVDGTVPLIDMPVLDNFLSDELSPQASELLWAEAFVATALEVAGVPMDLARTALGALARSAASPTVMRELGRAAAPVPEAPVKTPVARTLPVLDHPPRHDATATYNVSEAVGETPIMRQSRRPA